MIERKGGWEKIRKHFAVADCTLFWGKEKKKKKKKKKEDQSSAAKKATKDTVVEVIQWKNLNCEEEEL